MSAPRDDILARGAKGMRLALQTKQHRAGIGKQIAKGKAQRINRMVMEPFASRGITIADFAVAVGHETGRRIIFDETRNGLQHHGVT